MSKVKKNFCEKEIEFSIGEITLSGTFVSHETEQTSCAILLSGYGSTTRDNPTNEFPRYKVLAEQLVSKGITSLRFDDRGSGKSTMVNWHDYTFDDLAIEALAAVKFLKENTDVDPEKIGIVGHSLGAAIGPLSASKSNDIAFVVSAAPHGLIGVETALHSRNSLAKSAGETQEETNIWLKIIKEVLCDIRDNKPDVDPTTKLKQLMMEKYQKLSDDVKKNFPTFESYIGASYEGFLLTLGRTPMYRSFLTYDPIKTFKLLKCPVLLLFAGNDLMHPSIVHKNPIETALKANTRSDVNIEDFPEANHNFTKLKKQNEWEFIDNFSETIVDWIVKLS